MISSRVRIGPANDEDRAALERLLTFSLRPEASRWIVARFGGLIVGCGSIEPLGDHALLANLAVAVSHRNRSIGSTLVSVLLDAAAESGAGSVYTVARETAGFFRRLHWRVMSPNESSVLGLGDREEGATVFKVCLAERTRVASLVHEPEARQKTA